MLRDLQRVVSRVTSSLPRLQVTHAVRVRRHVLRAVTHVLAALHGAGRGVHPGQPVARVVVEPERRPVRPSPAGRRGRRRSAADQPSVAGSTLTSWPASCATTQIAPNAEATPSEPLPTGIRSVTLPPSWSIRSSVPVSNEVAHTASSATAAAAAPPRRPGGRAPRVGPDPAHGVVVRARHPHVAGSAAASPDRTGGTAPMRWAVGAPSSTRTRPRAPAPPGDETAGGRTRHAPHRAGRPDRGVTICGVQLRPAGSNVNETELMQKRWPVGVP